MSTGADRFEGLNLVDLMQLMHDLVWPEPVAMVPQTPGWWVLLGWLLVTVLVLGQHWRARRRAGRYRREALAQLRAIAAAAGEQPAQSAAQIAALLKRTALGAYPRRRVASLYGQDWAAFLCESCNNDAVVEQYAARLAAAAYSDEADGRALVRPARRWIKGHRVVEARGA